jgi:hypothetical protein
MMPRWRVDFNRKWDTEKFIRRPAGLFPRCLFPISKVLGLVKVSKIAKIGF